MSSTINQNIETEEHFVSLDADISLKCGIVNQVSNNSVVVWRWYPATRDKKSFDDRVLSVGKMLVRQDGKGKAHNFKIC